MLQWTRRVPLWLVDVALAAVFTVAAQVELRTSTDDGYRAGSLLLNAPLLALVTLSLAIRSRAPRAALAIMLAAVALPSVVVPHTVLFWGTFVPLGIALYTVARRDGSWFGWWSWPLTVVSTMLLAVHLPSARTLNDSLFVTVIFGAVWGSGRLVRSMAAQRHQLTVALEELAREQATREATAVQAERARIGMEMHDVVAHAVSLMVLQVGAARLALEKDALPAPDQLRAAEQTGRAALDEMRRSLMVIREDKDRGALLPLPGLDGLPALVDSFRSAGLDIELCTDAADGLPASLQLSAFRVLQEALTNVLKHAGPVPVRASVRCLGPADGRTLPPAGA